MDSKEVSLPLIHEHLMKPSNDLRRGDCCRRFETISDGKSCDLFVHKKCGESSEYVEHPSHPNHTLQLLPTEGRNYCNICGRFIVDLTFYHCEICNFVVDLYCAKYPPPEVIDISETHHHKLTLLKESIHFDCDAKCGEIGDGHPYKCHECDLSFHVHCVWNPLEATHPSEVNHFSHSSHPLKLHKGQPPDYSDGKCHLCRRDIDEFFYHCSSCNFTLDMCCVLNPPTQFVLNLKAHDHQLTLLPRLDSFTCNACGLKGDRSPYICVQCGFMIHQDCLDLPRLIEINRHDHNISRTYVLGVMNSVCGVCRTTMDWNYGGYSCQSCPGYFVHSRCATRRDVWNGKELEGVPDKTEYQYMVIDNTIIQHFSHIEHYLRLHVNGVLWEEENKRCRACTHPVGLQSFYNCIDCDFILHETCAGFPRNIWYQREDKVFDVLCGTIPEKFYHPSHPHHPLYHIPQDKERECNGCNKLSSHVLTCIEEFCGFVLDFKCATLPLVVKHSIDDHHFSLYYGKKENGKHLCDICGKETNIKTWFYTCKDHQDSLHIDCVMGDFSGLMPTSTIEVSSRSFKVVLNNSVTRPFCSWCKSRCMYPIMLKMLGTSDTYVCSAVCLFNVLDPTRRSG